MALFTTNHIQIFEYWVASGVYNYSIKIIQLLFENENLEILYKWGLKKNKWTIIVLSKI